MKLYDHILAAETRIRPYVLATPVEYSPALSELSGAEVWLKLEHIQRTGSFKLRGAANRLLTLSQSERQHGVITASTGNHGAAVAYMAQKLQIPCTVFLPQEVATSKLTYLQRLGAETIFVPGDPLASETTARQEANRQNRPFISPYNDLQVIAGQGTLGYELQQQVPQAHAVFVPVGGGGLISGVAGYIKTSKPQIEIIGCQPLNSEVMYASIQAGKVVDHPSTPTWSDGTAGGLETDSMTFSFCQKWVDEWIRVAEEEIEEALRLLLQEHYLLVEGAAALALASLLQTKSKWQGKQVVLILCGRKMGLKGLRRLIEGS